MSVNKDVASATVQAETVARVKDIADKQRIEVENYEEVLRVQREEAQYAQHKATQTANIMPPVPPTEGLYYTKNTKKYREHL